MTQEIVQKALIAGLLTDLAMIHEALGLDPDARVDAAVMVEKIKTLVGQRKTPYVWLDKSVGGFYLSQETIPKRDINSHEFLELFDHPTPIEWDEWRHTLATKVDSYINAQYEGDGDEEINGTYKDLKDHILKTPFASPTGETV